MVDEPLVFQRAHLADELVAIRAGHADIADQDVHLLAAQEVHRLVGIHCEQHVRAAFLEQAAEEQQRVRFVVDDEHGDVVEPRQSVEIERRARTGVARALRPDCTGTSGSDDR